MGNGLSRGRHDNGEPPAPQAESIPLTEHRRQLPRYPSSLHLEVPDLCYTEPPSACQSLSDLDDDDFKVNGINGSLGLSKDFLCVPDSLQEVKFWNFIAKTKCALYENTWEAALLCPVLTQQCSCRIATFLSPVHGIQFCRKICRTKRNECTHHWLPEFTLCIALTA